MSKKFFIVGLDDTIVRLGYMPNIGVNLQEYLTTKGLETITWGVPHPDPSHPEDFLRILPRLQAKLGQLDVLVFVAEHVCGSSTPDTIARDFLREFQRHCLGLVHAAIELRSLFSQHAQIIVIGPPIEGSFSKVAQAISEMFDVTVKLLRGTSGLEGLRICHLPVDYDGNEDYWDNFFKTILEIAQAPTPVPLSA